MPTFDANTSATQQQLPLPSTHGEKLDGFSGIANFLWSVAPV